MRTCHVYIGDKQEKEAMPGIVEKIEKEFGKPANPAAIALYVISNHIGTNASLAFWKDVINNGPAFANPELFPWTLANSACAYIARHFGITGPNYTYTFPPENQACMNEVLQQAGEDLRKLELENCWIIIVH
ncbi:MAG: hypothetical protein QM802_09890 [Agriterribacter sp.]